VVTVQLRERGLIYVTDENARALVEKPLGDYAADTRGARTDNDTFARQPEIHEILP
jgi:hypothetical protein